MKLELDSESAEIPEADVRNALNEILEATRLLTLATAGKSRPWASVAFFAADAELNLYILTEVDSQHALNTKLDPKVAVTIFDSHQDWGPGDLRGLQVEGICHRLDGHSREIGWAAYSERFSEVKRYFESTEDLDDDGESDIYMIQLQSIKMLYERHFGPERYVQLNVIR